MYGYVEMNYDDRLESRPPFQGSPGGLWDEYTGCILLHAVQASHAGVACL